MQGRKLDQLMDDQFATGRLYAAISSRPGQVRPPAAAAAAAAAAAVLHPSFWAISSRPVCMPRLAAAAARQAAAGSNSGSSCAARAINPPSPHLLLHPPQCGRADGYILEGRELEFYVKKMQKKKGKSS